MIINDIKNTVANMYGLPQEGQFAKYSKGVALGDYLDLSLDLVTDPAHRGLLQHLAHCKYSTFSAAQTSSILTDLRLLKAIRKATSAYTVGHKIEDRLVSYAEPLAAAAGAAAGEAVVWTLSPTYSYRENIAFDLGDQIKIEGSDVRVEVIGIDNGGVLNKYGKDTTGAPVTSGSLGGTPTAHKYVVRPIGNEIVPAVTTTTKLVMLTTLREDGSCPNNYYVAKLPSEARFGFSQVRSDYKETANTSATAVSCEFMAGGNKYKFLSSYAQANFHALHMYKVCNEIWFGERATNLLIEGREKKQNNGVWTQILANGGYVKGYTSGAWTFADTKALIGNLKERGVTEAIVYAGSDLWQQMMDSVTGSSFWSNVTLNIDNYRALQEGVCLNATMNCFEYGGVKLYFRDNFAWSDPYSTGINYSSRGIVMPLNRRTMQKMDGTMEDCFGVNVWFKEDQRGQLFDENYGWNYGGAVKHDSGCDFHAEVRKTELCTEIVGVEQWAAIQTV